jgi:hypothetical protein
MSYPAQVAPEEAAIAAAQAAGQAAELGRRQHYAQAILSAGCSYGDLMGLPLVPEQVTSPAGGFLYGQGDQPGA